MNPSPEPSPSAGRAEPRIAGKPCLAIIGSPNVGKSVIFNALTGAYVTVSNYPGTTVEVTRGKARLGDREVEVIDTPGIYSLLPVSQEETVTRQLLLEEQPGTVLHVVDAKNLPRMLPLTLQLLEAGLPVVLVLNLMDEADDLGLTFDCETLSRALGIPVFPTAGTLGRGIDELKTGLAKRLAPAPPAFVHPVPESAPVRYAPQIEEALREIQAAVDPALAAIAPRATALLLLQRDPVLLDQIQRAAQRVLEIVAATEARFAQPLPLVVTLARQEAAQRLVERVVRTPGETPPARWEWLSRKLIHPVWGLPVLAFVLYFGVYWLVGVFGAGTLVDFFQKRVFGQWINPPATHWLQGMLPPLWSSLFVGEYGILTLGITYAVAIVLPIVTLFFLVFAVLEDSGYLPRLALLIDRLFKGIGLNGRAVIPLVLGFGCDTMATMVTRVLETRRERLITAMLLALAVPCSAQSGLFLAMVGAISPYGLLIYVGILVMIFLVVGILAACLMPGERSLFYMEIPPLRLPRVRNLLVKTYARLEWYLLEVIPMFVLASVVLWLGSLTWQDHALVFRPHHGILGWVERSLDPLGALIGLPTSADVARNPALEFTGGTILVAGFFRRDFGAAGLWHLFSEGLITPVQVLVAAVTFTLFLPCIAQFLMMKKELGLKATLFMSIFILIVAFGVGYLLRVGLESSDIHLILNQPVARLP